MRRSRAALGRALRAAFLLLAVVLVALALRDQGPQAREAFRAVGPAAAAGSLVAVLAGLLASALCWRALLADLGAPLRRRAALGVFFLGQLGKYVPGSVFAVAAQVELGRTHGASRSRVATAGLLFLGVLVVTGLLVAAAVLALTGPALTGPALTGPALTGPAALPSPSWGPGAWVLALLPLGVLALAPAVLTRLVSLLLRLLRRDPLPRPLSARGVGAAVGWALAMWAAYGLHLWLLVRTLDPGPALLLSTGAYALAWTAGLLVVAAPAGAGVREVALVATLAPLLDRGSALAVAVLSRALMTLGDLAWGGVGAVLHHKGRGAVKTPRRGADTDEEPFDRS